MAQVQSAAAKEAAKATNAATTRVARVLKKGLFAKELAPMMYGFGDENPAADTVSVMEELLIEHITDICTQAQRISTNRGKIKVEDFKFALRKDPKKLARVEELLFMTEDIARARGKDDYAAFAEEGAEGKKGAAAAAAAAEGVPTTKAKGKGKAKA